MNMGSRPALHHVQTGSSGINHPTKLKSIIALEVMQILWYYSHYDELLYVVAVTNAYWLHLKQTFHNDWLETSNSQPACKCAVRLCHVLKERYALFSVLFHHISTVVTEVMSSPKSSSIDLSRRKGTINTKEEITTAAGGPKPHTEFCDTTTLCQHRGEPMLPGACHAGAETTTRVLHESEDDKPTITLTSYTDKSPNRRFMVRLLEPTHLVDDDCIIPISLEEALVETYALPDGNITELRRGLEEHFEVLKCEFEQKTGKAWIPLRAWPEQEWEWTSDEPEEDDSMYWSV